MHTPTQVREHVFLNEASSYSIGQHKIFNYHAISKNFTLSLRQNVPKTSFEKKFADSF